MDCLPTYDPDVYCVPSAYGFSLLGLWDPIIVQIYDWHPRCPYHQLTDPETSWDDMKAHLTHDLGLFRPGQTSFPRPTGACHDEPDTQATHPESQLHSLP